MTRALSDGDDTELAIHFSCMADAYLELVAVLELIRDVAPVLAWSVDEPRRHQFATLAERVTALIDALPIEMTNDEQGDGDD